MEQARPWVYVQAIFQKIPYLHHFFLVEIVLHYRHLTPATGDTGGKDDEDNYLYYAVALHFMHYNFGRIHKTLRVTPAMEAGVADHVWSLEDIATLAD